MGLQRPAAEAERNVTLAEYIDIVRRRRLMIGYTFTTITMVGIVATLLTAPIYRASAYLLVKAPDLRLNQVDASNPLSDLFSAAPSYKIETQVRLLKSADLLQAVAKKLAVRRRELPTLNVKAIEDTDIIQVDAETLNAKRAALVANTLLNTYIDQTSEINGREIRRALHFTEEGAARAQKDLEDTERSLRQFEQSHKVIELDKNREAQIAQVQRLTDGYDALQTSLAATNSRLAAANSELAAESPVESAVVSADSDPAVQSAQSLLAGIEAQRAGLVKRYTPVNKQVVALDAQIAAQRAYLRHLRGATRARNARKNPVYDAIRERRALLQETATGAAAEAAKTAEQLAAARTQLERFPAWKQQMARLQRQLEIAKSNYTLLSAKREDLRLRDQVQRVDARVMEYAAVPEAPIRPQKALNIIFAAVAGLVLGLVFALVQEYLDDRINSQDEAERVFHLPTLGLLPLVPEEGLRLLKSTRAFSPFTEAYRGLRTNIGFAAVDNPIRTLLITSTSPGEGKSHIAANLAIAMAMEGRRVVVLDADLRRPTQHKLFGLEQTPGLTDVLIGTHSLSDVLTDTDFANISLVTAGSQAPNPAELLGSEAMARLIDAMRGTADIILVDSPPVLAVSDSVLLSSRVDGVLFVASHAETKKGSGQQALQLLSRARAKVIGTVLNKIDPRDRGYYNYYHYEYSHSDIKSGGEKPRSLVSNGAGQSPIGEEETS